MEVKLDMYGNGDRRDIVDFVKEVEKYRCLYDKTSPEYANKIDNRRAWHAIANKCNSSVPECRDKWRKIRISFMRSLKQHMTDKPPRRPYYLSDELQFLLPFIKIGSRDNDDKVVPVKPKKIQPKVDPEPMETEIVTVGKDVLCDTDSSYSSENDTNENVKDSSRVAYGENTIRNLIKGIDNGKLNGGRQSYFDDIEVNPRKMFLLSMLPDIQSLTEQEMRLFKREVTTIIDNIINRRII